MKRRLLIFTALVACASAHAQNAVLQQGPWKAGDLPAYSSTGSSVPVITDSGFTAAQITPPPQTFTIIPGVVCDGVTDDAPAINAALGAAASGAQLHFPFGATCVILSGLLLPDNKTNVTIDLNGSLLLYEGASSSIDLMRFGTSTGDYDIELRNGRIWSTTFMTAGAALHLFRCGQCRVINIQAQKYSTTLNTLWNSFQVDWPNFDVFDDAMSQAQNDCIAIAGGGSSTASYDVYFVGGEAKSCTHAIHAAGGFDNLNMTSFITTNTGNNLDLDESSTLGSCGGHCYVQRVNIDQTVSFDYSRYYPTQVASVAANGSGGTNSSSCFVQTAGTGQQPVLDVTISGGALTAINHIHPQGGFITEPTNPVSLAAYSGAGACTGIPAGATVNLNWTGGDNVYINMPDCTHAGGTTPNASVIMGARLSSGTGAGVHLVALSSSAASGQQCPLILNGGQITAAGGDGLLVDDANALVSMSPSLVVTKNTGWGINASAPWSGLLTRGVLYQNATGQIAPNVVMPAGDNGKALIPASPTPLYGGTCAATPVTGAGYYSSEFTINSGGCTSGEYVALTFAQTAPHDWECSATNWTDPTRTMVQNYGTQTVSRLLVGAGGVNSADDIHYQCMAR